MGRGAQVRSAKTLAKGSCLHTLETVLFVWPIEYQRLVRRGDWRLTVVWKPRLRLARVVDRFDDGTVYRFWCAWLFVKVMVKA
jgi:hypothetical protein